jgi:cytoskeletal protein RodZ
VNPENTKSDFANSVGELLRSKREGKKLTLADVNQDTKVSINVLKALEQEDFGSFESETYLRGFLKNYAKYLGIEPDFVIGVLEGQRGGEKTTRGTMWDIEESVREEKLTSPRILTRFVVPVLIVVILILSVLLALEHRKVKELQSNLRRIGQTTESVERHAV